MTTRRRLSAKSRVRGMLAGYVANLPDPAPRPGVDEAALTAIREYATTTGAEPLTYRAERRRRRATRPVTTLPLIADAA